MIVNKLSEIKSQTLYYNLKGFLPSAHCYVKLEGYNIAGSIKLKTASRMVNSLEQEGTLSSSSVLICSTSGNLGLALSIVCKEKGYPLICVTDPNTLPSFEKYIKLWGAEVITVKKKDSNGGYLQSRIQLIESLLKKNSNYIFVDQYKNKKNSEAHYQTTAKELFTSFENIDFLFIGAGTTGTLNGCGRFFKQFSPKTHIIAVDAYGSVTFDTPPYKRKIPGLGTSFKPKLASQEYIDKILWVKEPDTVHMCRALLKSHGLLLGGSSGSILHAVRQHQAHIPNNATVVAISPDNGDKYIDTIYNDSWITQNLSMTLAKQ